MILSKCFDFLKPAAFPKPIQSFEEIDSSYRYWRIRTFYSIYMGYFFYYFTRKSLTFVAPFLTESNIVTIDDIGKFMTILAFAYGLSKFTSGIMCDRSNPRYFMAMGIIFTGVCNIFLGLSSSVFFIGLWWGLNGWFQGWGWPACTKQLTHWYSRKERGTWWSVCTTSHNFGGFVVAFLSAYIAKWYGWRYGMIIPGVICILIGFWLINRLRDVPESLGLPKIECYKDENNSVPITQTVQTTKAVQTTAEETTSKITSRTPAEKPSDNILTPSQILFEHVLNNKFVWILGLSYFFVYVVRIAVNDWGVFYLVDAKGFERIAATGAVATFEIGGVFGMLFAGFASDYFFKGKRVPIMVLCSLGLLLSILGLWFLPFNDQQWWLAALLMGMVGFLVFGPQMLVGLTAAEFVTKKAASTSNGFVGCFGYLGAGMAGYPLIKLKNLIGWYGFMGILVMCALLAVLILSPIWSLRSDPKEHIEKDSDVEADLETDTA